VEEAVEQVRGAPERPFTRGEIDAKFDANAAPQRGAQRAAVLREAIRTLPHARARDVL
jgi:hypothetical protein